MENTCKQKKQLVKKLIINLNVMKNIKCLKPSMMATIIQIIILLRGRWFSMEIRLGIGILILLLIIRRESSL